MKLLILDTSSKYLSLALAQDNKILGRMHRRLDRKRSLQLVPMINSLLKKRKLTLQKLDGFCVNRGPGSFTGLRIGITTIKGLAFALGKPVIAIPGLDILVQNANRIKDVNNNFPSQICALVDARQNKVYACLYRLNNGKISRKSGYLLLPLPELLKRLKGEIIFLGDGIRLYASQIRSSRGIKPVFAEERFWYPKATDALSLARERFSKGDFDDANSLAPLYLYPKECQVKRKK